MELLPESLSLAPSTSSAGVGVTSFREKSPVSSPSKLTSGEGVGVLGLGVPEGEPLGLGVGVLVGVAVGVGVLVGALVAVAVAVGVAVGVSVGVGVGVGVGSTTVWVADSVASWAKATR